MYEGSLYEGGEGAYFLPYIPAGSCHGECPHGEDIRCIKTCLILQQSIHRIVSYLLHYQLVAEQAIRMLRYAVFDLPCRFHPPPPRLALPPPSPPLADGFVLSPLVRRLEGGEAEGAVGTAGTT